MTKKSDIIYVGFLTLNSFNHVTLDNFEEIWFYVFPKFELLANPRTATGMDGTLPH